MAIRNIVKEGDPILNKVCRPVTIAQMVRVGACDATGGVADRWDIDSGAAGGAVK